MKRQDFYYDLPEELIAQDPLEDRSSSRLLVLDKETGATSHHIFKEITGYLKEGDCLVINDTKVIPARLIGAKEGTGAKIEVLLLKRKENNIWETLVKPGNKNRDQTVYAKHTGSAAAPTAGLHFTPELLKEIEEKGIDIARVTLHVGLGTFRPVKVDEITDHHMHSEFYQVDEEAAEKINRAKDSGHRVICVGTTSCRTIESAADETGHLKPTSGWTEIFIYPGYKFKILDGLITNFHLPESTLIMLVSALAGREHVLAAYEEAVQERYRFFSFGDAMLII